MTALMAGGAGHGAKLTALSQRAVLELLSAWPELQRVGLKLRGSASGLALLKVLATRPHTWMDLLLG